MKEKNSHAQRILPKLFWLMPQYSILCHLCEPAFLWTGIKAWKDYTVVLSLSSPPTHHVVHQTDHSVGCHQKNTDADSNLCHEWR